MRVLKFHKIIYLAIFFLVFIIFSCNDSKNSRALEFQELSLVWKHISMVYVNNHGEQQKVDSLYYVYLSKIERNENEDYQKVINSFVNEIHDGHTRYHFSKDHFNKQYSVPILTKYTNGQYMVSAFGEELKNKISLGDIVVNVNGLNTEEYVKKVVYPTNFCTKYSYKYTLANNIFYGNEGDVFEIELKGKSGKRKKIKLKTTLTNHVYYKQIQENSNPYLESISFKRIGNTAYIRIPTFRTDIGTQFKSFVDSLIAFDNIIFDLRGNKGGSSTDGEISQYFSTKDSIPLFCINYKSIDCKKLAYSSLNNSQVKSFLNIPKSYSNEYDRNFFNGILKVEPFVRKNNVSPKGLLSSINIIILIDYNTASAAESFILELKAIGKGFCIGQPTYGSSAMPTFFTLPSGSILSVSTIWTNYFNQSQFSNIIPDILIDPSIDDYLNNNDIILKTALNYVNEKTN